MVDEDPHNKEGCDLLDGAPEAPDVPAPLEIADVTVPEKTWATLVDEAALPEVSYAHQLHHEHSEANWELMLLPFTKLAIAVNNQQYDQEVAMWQFADAPGKHMFLVVKQSKFEVLYGMRQCTPIHQLGEHVAWLLGDRRVVAGSTVPPGLLIKALGRNTQSDLFAKVEVQAPGLDKLCAATEAQPEEQLHDQDANQAVTTWLMLPVHLKLACLYMKGLELSEGFVLGCQILDLIQIRGQEAGMGRLPTRRSDKM
jgi:hypothetical protein